MSEVPPLKLRKYQQEAAAAAISGNIVINIPTGGGKTLIAVSVINHFMRSSEKTVCFLVPSRPLVSQQAAYLRTYCDEKQGATPLVEGEDHLLQRD
jgi:ERCC4-related helicase